MEKIIIAYQNAKDKIPFEEWLNKLDKSIQNKILDKVDNLKFGLGDYKNLKGGLFEMRINAGAGYRIYFTERKGMIIILLSGGTKHRQQKDIEKAREYLEDCKKKGGF